MSTFASRLMIACSMFTALACANGTSAPDLHRASTELAQRVSLERAWSEATSAHVPEWRGEVVTLSSGPTTARFDEVGAELSLADHPVRIHLTALGRQTLRSMASAPVTIAGVEVRYERAPGVREWWRGLPSGLEHGVTVNERIAGEGRLVLELAVSGARVSQAADGVAFTSPEGERIGRYHGLVVLDARERRVPAALITAPVRRPTATRSSSMVSSAEPPRAPATKPNSAPAAPAAPLTRCSRAACPAAHRPTTPAIPSRAAMARA